MTVERVLENIESMKQALHSLRLTGDITPAGKAAMELGFDVFIEEIKKERSFLTLSCGTCTNYLVCEKIGRCINMM